MTRFNRLKSSETQRSVSTSIFSKKVSGPPWCCRGHLKYQSQQPLVCSMQTQRAFFRQKPLTQSLWMPYLVSFWAARDSQDRYLGAIQHVTLGRIHLAMLRCTCHALPRNATSHHRPVTEHSTPYGFGVGSGVVEFVWFV